MRILSIDEARRISSNKYEANMREWNETITDCIAIAMSAAMVDGKFRCKVDFTSYAQDEAFHDSLNEICNNLEKEGYDILYTTSGSEIEDTFICENIRISWY